MIDIGDKVLYRDGVYRVIKIVDLAPYVVAKLQIRGLVRRVPLEQLTKLEVV
ncbi:hypothetical protein [Liquorilactobacillus satsumensis]|uniref:hypothetical protein n=1 Tax=Liquorilactobacillus satsumensis TaxID=259059 RepID=UPI0039E83511